MTRSTQLLGISNAIVDVLAHIDEDFLDKIGVVKGAMTLIDEERAHEIYSMMGPAMEMSGGSVANTIASFANLGGEGAYIGRVKADQLGAIFNHDMRSLGIDIRLDPGQDGPPTARSHVMISADGQRTMCTYLGACTELEEEFQVRAGGRGGHARLRWLRAGCNDLSPGLRPAGCASISRSAIGRGCAPAPVSTRLR